MLKKLILTFLLFYSLLLASPILVQAADDIPPALNPICWEKTECWAKRKEILNATGVRDDKYIEEQAEKGWINSEPPCTGDWGKCLPANLIETEIKFGGTSTFTDIGKFLITNYNYLLGVASILAVVMIVVAGFQWAASGGNSEMISSAKKRITGAIIGLFIAYMSYFILNTINPALVNLRLPQTWLIRSDQLAGTFCNSVDPSARLAYAGQGNSLIPRESLKVEDFKLSPSYFKRGDTAFQQALEACAKLEKKDWLESGGVIQKYWCLEGLFQNLEKDFAPLEKNLIAMCGHKYYMSNKIKGTCEGSICRPTRGKNIWGNEQWFANSCQKDLKTDAYGCVSGAISGKVSDPENKFGDAPLESFWLAEVCNDGEVNEQWTYKVGSKTDPIKTNNSYFTYGQEYISGSTACDDHNGVAGVYMILNLDDKAALSFLTFGANDDDYAVGCPNGGKSSICDKNLAYVLHERYKGNPKHTEIFTQTTCDPTAAESGVVDCTTSNNTIEYEEEEVRTILSAFKTEAVDIIRPYLIQPMDIYQGMPVEINLSEGFFPD